jgi:glycine cleavage system pyridoxal-binding protein P
MEALVNFQTMVTDLTGMAIANASMLDEATAAAEAMTLARRSSRPTHRGGRRLHPQTIEVMQTRAAPLGLGRGQLGRRVGRRLARTTTLPPASSTPPAAAG